LTTHTEEWTSPPADEIGFVGWLRERCAQAPVQEDPRTGTWHVFGYQEALAALSDHAALSSAVVSRTPADSPMKLYATGNLSWLDPPQHGQLRRLVSQVFTARYVAGLRPMIESTVEEFLGRIRSRPEIAYVEEYAAPIVSTVIARMVGVTRHQLFRKWARDLLTLIDTSATTNGVRQVATNTQLIAFYLHEFIEQRRKAPTDDLTSRLIGAQVEGERLDDDEIAGLIALLMSTGQAATLTLGNAAICFDQFPEAAQELRRDPTLIGGAIDEVMRFRNQTTRVSRRSVRDVEIGGLTIPAGRSVSIWLAAANFDERQFDDPGAFRITRSPSQHLALGHGIHYCLGGALARQEIEIALARLLAETREFTVDHSRSRLLDPRSIFGAGELSLRVHWR
jgi:cytochrome P450